MISIIFWEELLSIENIDMKPGNQKLKQLLFKYMSREPIFLFMKTTVVEIVQLEEQIE